MVHAAGRVRPRAADRRAHGLGAERRLARRLPERARRASRCCGGSPRRASRRSPCGSSRGPTRRARASAARCSARRPQPARWRDQDELRAAEGPRRDRAARTRSREHGVDLDGALAARVAARERGRLPRAAHRAGAGARVDGSAARRRARHVRRRALAVHVARPGRARRLDADGQAPRRARRRGEARALHPRDRRRGRRRRGVHVGRRRRRSRGSSPRSSRRPSSCSTSATSTRRRSRGCSQLARDAAERFAARGEHRGRVGADLEHRADPVRRDADRASPTRRSARSRARRTGFRPARCTTPPRSRAPASRR